MKNQREKWPAKRIWILFRFHTMWLSRILLPSLSCCRTHCDSGLNCTIKNESDWVFIQLFVDLIRHSLQTCHVVFSFLDAQGKRLKLTLLNGNQFLPTRLEERTVKTKESRRNDLCLLNKRLSQTRALFSRLAIQYVLLKHKVTHGRFLLRLLLRLLFARQGCLALPESLSTRSLAL